jgi:cytoskeletal protein CcmA (bactofilin family)
MFGKSNGQLLDEQLGVAPSRETSPRETPPRETPPRDTPPRETKPAGAMAQPQHSGFAQPSTTPEIQETISTLGPGMAIVGKIDCQGTLHIFGRIEGELHATNVLIGNGAQFDGKVIAQGVTIDGRLTGTIHATRVNLQSNAVVEGDIFHRVLSINENAQFEGSSRRVENPTDAPTNSLKLDWSRAEPIRTEEKSPW